MAMDKSECLPISNEIDIIKALAKLREQVIAYGFNDYDVSRTLTAASELIRNILKYAEKGVVHYTQIKQGTARGIGFSAIDQGPGIENIDEALKDNYSTSGTLGLGLPGVKRIVDNFNIDSLPGQGTTVSFEIWCR